MYYFLIPIEILFDLPDSKISGEDNVRRAFSSGDVLEIRYDLDSLCSGEIHYFGVNKSNVAFNDAYVQTIKFLSRFLNSGSTLTSCGAMLAQHLLSSFTFKNDPSLGIIILCEYVDFYTVLQSLWGEMHKELETLMYSSRVSQSVDMAMAWYRTAHYISVTEIQFNAFMMALECLAGYKREVRKGKYYYETKWHNIERVVIPTNILTKKQFQQLKNLRNAYMHGRPKKGDYQMISKFMPKLPLIFIQMLRRNKSLNINHHIPGVGRGRAARGNPFYFRIKDNVNFDYVITHPITYLNEILDFHANKKSSTSLCEWLHSGTGFDPKTF